MSQEQRTTIGLSKLTKEGLARNKAPGQSYDGFIRQLVDLWEIIKEQGHDYMTDSTRETKVLGYDIAKQRK
jgi:hypothetical protein